MKIQFRNFRQLFELTNEKSTRQAGGQRRSPVLAGVLAAALFVVAGAGLAFSRGDDDRFVPPYQEFMDPQGRFANLNTNGFTDTTKNAFFEDLGTNGRRCVT